VTRGAICLSASSHFPPMEASKLLNPVIFPPGRAKLFDEAAFHRIRDARKHDGYRGGDLAYGRNPWIALYQDYFRLQRDHFLGEREHLLGKRNVTSVVPAKIDTEVAACSPTQLLKRLLERHHARLCFPISFGDGAYDADPPRGLRLRTRNERAMLPRRRPDRRTRVAAYDFP